MIEELWNREGESLVLKLGKGFLIKIKKEYNFDHVHCFGGYLCLNFSMASENTELKDRQRVAVQLYSELENNRTEVEIYADIDLEKLSSGNELKSVMFESLKEAANYFEFMQERSESELNYLEEFVD